MPVLIAMTDNGPQMRSHSTKEFMAACAIMQRFGRPGKRADGESTGYGVELSLGVDDVEECVQRLHAHGARLQQPLPMSRGANATPEPSTPTDSRSDCHSHFPEAGSPNSRFSAGSRPQVTTRS